jgi:hypothetical protein
MPESTRLSICKQALDDILERLNEMPATPRVRELRAKATSYERVVRAWDARPPTEQERSAMLKNVIDLNVEVIAAGKT